jgi:hypothetical protein
LITALHRAAQRKLPVVLVGAGLPQLRGRMGRAKSYAERLFDFSEIGPLPPPPCTRHFAQRTMLTGVPGGAFSKNFSAAPWGRRMQPWEAA